MVTHIHKMQSTILLVDDHPVFRKGMRALLEDEEDILVIGEAGDGKSALKHIRDSSPDIVVMDVTMPELNGIKTTQRILAEFPDTIVVALSIHAEKQFVQDMLQAGAAGYMLKDSGSEELIKGIRAIMAGDGYLSPAITRLVVSQFRESVTQAQIFQTTSYEIPDTKFHLPRLPTDHIQRPRLLERLETARHLSVQCIIAPAGYGKTTLASNWLINHQWPNAWISLDEKDNDFRKFVFCFIHAVKMMFPTALSKIDTLVRVGNLPPIQTLAVMLVNELNQIQDDFILVLDDFHKIREKSVHDLLSEVFRHPLAFMHIVVVSRTNPFIPISRLRAQNHLAEIRLNDLQFTKSETATFLKSTLDQEIHESVSSSLHQKTEGWITGLRLAMLSIRENNDLDHLLQEVHGCGDYIKEYLFNEVWGRQPENIRKHIVVVSILERFSAPLFEVLCPYASDGCEFSGWDIIIWLKKNNMFLVPLDDEGRWFRFHHLFQELLQGQLKRTLRGEEIHELHLQAGSWLAEHGLYEEAINHILAADRPGRAGELVAQLGHTLIDQEQVVDLANFLRKLPQEVIDHNPLLLIYEAWLARVNFLVPKITEKLKKVEEILKREPLPDAMSDIIWGYWYTIHSYERYCLLDQKKALSSAKRALETLPPEYRYMRAFASILQAEVLQITGRYQEAREVADVLTQHALETDQPVLLVAAQAFQAELALRQGRLDEAIAWAHLFEPRKFHARYFFFLPELTLVKVLLTEDTKESCQKAQNLLLDIETFSRSTFNRSVLIPALILQSIALYSHDRHTCLEKAAESVSLAQDGGGLRFFLDYDSPMKDILMQLKGNTISEDFIEHLLIALNDHKQENRPFIPSREIADSSSAVSANLENLSDPLTDRELEILNQLVKGKSNKEIGKKLFISVDTVKSHLKRVFQKLDVKSRLQAVAKATELGIVDTK